MTPKKMQERASASRRENVLEPSLKAACDGDEFFETPAAALGKPGRELRLAGGFAQLREGSIVQNVRDRYDRKRGLGEVLVTRADDAGGDIVSAAGRADVGCHLDRTADVKPAPRVKQRIFRVGVGEVHVPGRQRGDRRQRMGPDRQIFIEAVAAILLERAVRVVSRAREIAGIERGVPEAQQNDSDYERVR